MDADQPAVPTEPLLLNATEVAAETGITLDETRRLWRALGFPEQPPGVRAYTGTDVEAVSTLVAAVDSGLLDFDLAVQLTRALGQTMARLADWEVGALVARVERLEGDGTDGTDGSHAGSAARLVHELGDGFEELVLYAWRRHLAAAVARMEALGAADPREIEGALDEVAGQVADPSGVARPAGEGGAATDRRDLHTTTLTVGFADIVSFTALSNEITRHQVGDLVELFESRCADVVATQGGRVIKSIGDSVLFVNDDPIEAYDTAEGIIHVIGRDPRMPDVRVGLATGSVVMRLGDVFGPPVNMAARLTAVARRNRIIIDASTAGLLPADQFETRRLPARPVRGFGLVEPLTVRRH